MNENKSIVRPSVASLLVLGLFACEGPASDEFADASRVRAMDLEQICPAHTQIARVASGLGCLNVPGWSGSELFANSDGVLADFCRYEWGGVAGMEDLDDFPIILGPGVSVSPDCYVVHPQTGTDALWDVVGPNLEALFHHAIGRASADDLDLKNTEASRSPVIVVVVDSVPQGVATPRSEHGELMASLVHDIACPDGKAPCKAKVRRVLGLPFWGPDHEIDMINGGDYGSQTRIATSIYDSVEAWRTTPWPNGTPKLIINLSVGWEDEFGGDDPLDMPAPVESVYEAIAYANCHGALVIAAAGNQGHLCSPTPVLPGAWEEQAAPDAARCAELSAPPPPTGGSYHPLIYSVGGLDTHGNMMPGTRLEGMPRLAAVATHAVAGGDSTALTGTSVASAVASGTAALVWSYNPHLDPAEVMGSIYAGGTQLSGQADYIMPGQFNPFVHEIHVCSALERACRRQSSNCPSGFDSTLACLDAPAPTSLAEIVAEIAGASPVNAVTPSLGAGQACDVGCDGGATTGYLSATFGSGADPCPAPITPALPYVEPMPTEVACPNCTLDVTGNSPVVYAALDPSYAGIDVLDVMVTVVAPTQTTHFRLGGIELSNSVITSITLDSELMPETIVSASISITFDAITLPRPIVDDLLIE